MEKCPDDYALIMIKAASLENRVEIFHRIQHFYFRMFFHGKQKLNSKRIDHPYVHCNILHNRQGLETILVPRGKRKDYIYEYTSIHMHTQAQTHTYMFNYLKETIAI